MSEAGLPPPRPAAPPPLKAELRSFAQLAGPMVVSRMGVAALAFTDGVMLARSGSEALAVHGLSESLMGRVIEVAMVTATAGLALAAQAHAGGARTAMGVGTVWHNGLALATGLGMAALLFSAFGAPILHALGQPHALVSQTSLVIGVIGLSVWPALVGLVCGGILETIGRARTVVVAVVLANLVNIALNQWLIFGGLGVPPLGALGAATSTLAVRVLMAVGMLTLLWRAGHRGEAAAYGLHQRFDRQAWRAGAEQRRRGAAAAATVGVLALVSFGLPVMAGWLGALALAQVTALFLCLAPVLVVAWGLADASALRIAAVAGSSHPGGMGLRTTGWRLMITPAVVLIVASALFAGASGPLLRSLLEQPELVAGVRPLLFLGLLVAAGDTLSIVLGAMLRSLGVLRGPLLVQAVGSLALLPLAGLLAFGAGWHLSGLLAAQGGIALVRTGVLAVMFNRTARALDLIRHTAQPATQMCPVFPSPLPARPCQRQAADSRT